MFRLLVGVYLAVSVVAYTDFPREAPNVPLTAHERRGLTVWRKHNCQACHQIYGFGGFLGPDLTNRVTEETQDLEFLSLLKIGRGRMPPLDLAREDQEAVLAYLRAVNATGRSQPAPLAARKTVDQAEHLRLLTDEWTLGITIQPPVRMGCDTFVGLGCGACHIPFVMGPTLAPDVTAAAADRSFTTLHALMQDGRGKMPAYEVTRGEIQALCAYLDWVAANRAALANLNDSMLEREEFRWNNLPWFEYR